MPNFPTEPDADKRSAAAEMWALFVALKAEGFTEHQAVAILGHLLAAGSK